MRIHSLFLLSTLLWGCAETNETNGRRVDGARPATGCNNRVGTGFRSRLLQDVEGGGCLAMVMAGYSDRYPGLAQTVDEDVGVALAYVLRFAVACDQVAELEGDAAYPVEVEGWLTLERGESSSTFLSASFDVRAWEHHPEIPPATVRIENMDINDREGWIECAPF